LGNGEGECVHGHYQNYCTRCVHVFFYQQFDLRANSLDFEAAVHAIKTRTHKS
jgi:hypothetical protein